MKLLTLSDLKHFWTNAVQKIPIKISDLQDDVALGTHIADTDIHVTSSDKTTWNTVTSKANDSDVVHKSGNETISGVKSFINYFLGKDLSGQTVDLNDCVDAYSGAIHYYYAVSNYTNISNKPENKPFILESKTVRYVSSIDYIYYQKIYTADYNASPSIYTRYYRSGSASWSNWIKDTDKFVTTDTAQTISGVKNFSSNMFIYNSDDTATTPNLYLRSSKIEISSQGNTSGDQNLTYLDKNNTSYAYVKGAIQSNGSAVKIRTTAKDSSDNSVVNELQILAYTNGNKAIFPTYSNETDLGVSNYKWKSIFATNYYYGNDNVEFSQKFVTTDTAQTVSGNKTFSSNVNVYNSDNTATTPNLILKNSKVSKGSTSEIGAQLLKFVDKNNSSVGELESIVTNLGASELRFRSNTLNSNNQNVQTGVTLISNTSGAKRFCPTSDNDVFLGASTLKWSRVYSTNYYYGNDNVEFSTKFVTTDTNQTVSGSKTFSDGIVLNSLMYFTNTSVTKGTIPQSTISPYRIYFGSGVNYANSLFNIDTSVSNTGAQALTLRSAENVVNGDDTRLVIAYDPNLTQPKYASLTGDFIPRTNNTYECGTNKNKWKSFNGVEPSSLSLPSGNLNDIIDISSYLTYLDGTDNTYVAPSNGWITINMNNCSGIHATIAGFWGDSRVRASAGAIKFLMPVLKNQTVTLTIHGGTINNARFIPCQGNV